MTVTEIKRVLKHAYALSESEKETQFVVKYEKRALKLSDILKLELRYMGLKSLLAGAALIAVLLIASKTGNEDTVWVFSSFIPVCALIPMELLSRSERFGMDELEAASRFSLRFIRIVRMLILGVFSMAVLLTAGVLLHKAVAASFAEQMVLVVFPYLISAYGALLVTRKRHGKDSIFGVLSVCVFSGLLPFVIRPISQWRQLPERAILLTIALLLTAIVRECMLYVKESEDLSWSYC